MNKDSQIEEKIQNILGEDAYNEAAFMFDDNKTRFCFTPEELVKKTKQLSTLFNTEIENAKKEWEEEQTKSILMDGGPNYMFDSTDGSIAKAYDRALGQQSNKSEKDSK